MQERERAKEVVATDVAAVGIEDIAAVDDEDIAAVDVDIGARSAEPSMAGEGASVLPQALVR